MTRIFKKLPAMLITALLSAALGLLLCSAYLQVSYADDWTAELYAKAYYDQPVYSEPLFEEEYGDGDTLYLDPSQKACVAFMTNADENLEHGLAPVVGWHDTITDENGKIIKEAGDLSKLGFEVTSGTIKDLGYAGKITDEDGNALDGSTFCIEIDPAELPLGTSGTLDYYLYSYDGNNFWDDYFSGAWTFGNADIAVTGKLNVVVANRIDFNNHDEDQDGPLYFNSTKTYQMTIPEAASQLGSVQFKAGAIGEDGFQPDIELNSGNQYSNAYASFDTDTKKLSFDGDSIYNAIKDGTFTWEKFDIGEFPFYNMHIRGMIYDTEGTLVAIGHANCMIPEVCDDNEHTAANKVIENKVAATYAAAGSYDEVVYCSVCHKELSRVTKTIAKKTVTATKLTKLNKAKKAFTAKWTKKTGVAGYQIQYGLKSNFKGAKSVTVKSATATSKKIKKLKAKKKYYVRIRTYVVSGGKTYYSAWSAKKTVKTK